MDSVSQIALGAAVGVATMGRRTAPWKAALWGGLCGTLPDLDALIDHGDAVSNMTLHRAETHALFWLTLASPVLAGLAAVLARERDRFGRWWLATWLVLVTHPLLDAMTVYGTQLALPFSDWPWGVGSVFIIDPLYTLPLLIGLAVSLARRGAARQGACAPMPSACSCPPATWAGACWPRRSSRTGCAAHWPRPATPPRARCRCWSRPPPSTPCSGAWW